MFLLNFLLNLVDEPRFDDNLFGRKQLDYDEKTDTFVYNYYPSEQVALHNSVPTDPNIVALKNLVLPPPRSIRAMYNFAVPTRS